MDDGNESGTVRGGGAGFRPGTEKPASFGLYFRQYPTGVYICRWAQTWCGPRWFCGHLTPQKAMEDPNPSMEAELPWKPV